MAQEGHDIKSVGRLTYDCLVVMRKDLLPPKTTEYRSLTECLLRDYEEVKIRHPEQTVSMRIVGEKPECYMTFWDGEGKMTAEVRYKEDPRIIYYN
jgi:hypothetical protein